MIQSRPIEIDGRFVGIAVNASANWHFVAMDPVLEDLDGAHFPNPQEMTRVARTVLARARGAHQAPLPFLPTA